MTDEKKPPQGVAGHPRITEVTEWRIEVGPEKVWIRRMAGEQACESYRFVDHGIAAVWLAAISQGFQPPRDLRAFGKAVG
jgi:hypothetical protein